MLQTGQDQPGWKQNQGGGIDVDDQGGQAIRMVRSRVNASRGQLSPPQRKTGRAEAASFL